MLVLILFALALVLRPVSAAATACPNGGHMSMISSYWVQSGAALGNWWPDIQWTYQTGHAVPMANDFSFLDSGTANAIVELYWTLFDYQGNGCDPNPTRAQNLAQMNTSLAPYVAANKISAFYIHDEPYANGCTIAQIEDAISATKAIWPEIPTYITFAQLCFDPSYGKCKTPSSQRGIPSNLDWMGFDWYLGSGTTSEVYEQFQGQIMDNVHTLISMMNPQQSVFLCADAFTANNQEPMLVQIAEMFWNFSQATPQVIGIDFFLYPSISPNEGINEMPILRASIRNANTSFFSSLARQVTYHCTGDVSIVPIFLYSRLHGSPSGSTASSATGHHHSSSGGSHTNSNSNGGGGSGLYYKYHALEGSMQQDNLYTAFAWDNWDPMGDYTPQGAQFGLTPLNSANASTLYSCWLASGSHWLTFSQQCDGKQVQSGTGAEALGGAFTSTGEGIDALNRFVNSKNPALYIYAYVMIPATFACSKHTAPQGYSLDATLAYAYPQAAL